MLTLFTLLRQIGRLPTTWRDWFDIDIDIDANALCRWEYTLPPQPPLLIVLVCLLADAFMTDLIAVLPTFSTQQYAHLLPSLERNGVTTADLLSLDAGEIAKRARVPLVDVKKLCAAVLGALQVNLGTTLRKSAKDISNYWTTISTLDEELDLALGGGIPTGCITEFTGER